MKKAKGPIFGMRPCSMTALRLQESSPYTWLVIMLFNTCVNNCPKSPNLCSEIAVRMEFSNQEVSVGWP